MNNRHRQVAKWNAYYIRKRKISFNEAVKIANDAWNGVANALTKFANGLKLAITAD